MCSSKRVPSVGIEPYRKEVSNQNGHGVKLPTPTELPKKKSAMQRVKNDFVRDARRPKRAVKRRVALKAALRPMRSEPL